MEDMNISELKQFIGRHSGTVDEIGYTSHGRSTIAHAYVTMPHHTAADIDTPDNVIVEQWDEDTVFFDLEL